MGQILVEKDIDGIEGLCVITPAVHGDSRGYFMETYSARDMEEAGFDIVFVQDNQSMSVKGVLRGLHFQKQFPQTKLVRVIKGEVYDVAVDLRKGSPTYKKWVAVELSAENRRMLMIPRGFGHGFKTLTENVEFIYKTDNLYNKESDRGIRFDDPAIGVNWGDVREELLSPKDMNAPLLAESDCNFVFEE